MAFADYNNLTALTLEKLLPKVFDNIFDNDPVLMRLLSKAERGSGKQLDIPVMYAKNTQGGWYAGNDTLDTASEETKSRASFTWKQIHQPVVLTGIDRAKNSGKEAIVDYVAQQVKEARMNLQDKMATSLYSDGTGSSSKELLGLRAICDDSSNIDSYAGITRSTQTWWKANYTASSGTLTTAKLGAMYDSCKSGSDLPTLIVTTEALWRAYEQLLNANQRFNMSADNVSADNGGYNVMSMDEGGSVSIGKGKNLMADGSFLTLFYNATPVVSSEYCGSTKWFFLNEKYIKFYYLPNVEYKTDKHGFSVTDDLKNTNQDGTVKHLLWYGALTCSQCRKQGQLTGSTA